MIAEKHPQENQRLATLSRYGILDSPPESAFDSLVAAAADIFDMPTVLVSLVDADRQWFKARVNMQAEGTPIEQSFCAHAILDSGILVVVDPSADPRFADNPLVLANDGIRFYAGAPLLADDGLPLGTLCLIDYVPRRFSAQDERRLRWLADQVMQLLEMHRLRVEAERSNVFKTRFLAAVSHEIRTPLSAILGYADLLSEELGESQQLEYVEGISRNSEHLHAIVDDLLNISRIEIGALELRAGRVDLEALLRDIHLLMDSRAAQQALAWRVLCDGPVPETIDTDEVRLRQILVNLLGNAMKRMQGGQVTLTVSESVGSLETLDGRIVRNTSVVVPRRLQPLREVSATQHTHWLHFAIRDTGDGLDADELHAIVEPALEPMSELSDSGAALGLPIARRLAELLGGVIRIHSVAGEGSELTFSMAIGNCDSTRRLLDLDAPVHIQGRATQSRLTGRRVLVVDDYPDILSFLDKALTRQGAEVLTASSGKAALALFDATDPVDAMILDIQLPDLSGLDIAQRLRRRGIAIPIIALTASAMPGQKEKCLEAGCNAFLSKPVLPRTLVAMLCRQLRQAQDRQSQLSAARAESPSTHTAHRHRVLIVDDHKDSAEVVARVLSRKGCETFTATDSAEAFAIAELRMPDLVILDWQLEDTTAPELLMRFREIPGMRDARYVALTGWSIDREEARSIGFSRVMQKPVGIQQLTELLESLGAPAERSAD